MVIILKLQIFFIQHARLLSNWTCTVTGDARGFKLRAPDLPQKQQCIAMCCNRLASSTWSSLTQCMGNGPNLAFNTVQTWFPAFIRYYRQRSTFPMYWGTHFYFHSRHPVLWLHVMGICPTYTSFLCSYFVLLSSNWHMPKCRTHQKRHACQID